MRRIARALRMSPGTILRYLRTGHVADWRPGRTAPSRLDPFRAYLDERLARSMGQDVAAVRAGWRGRGRTARSRGK